MGLLLCRFLKSRSQLPEFCDANEILVGDFLLGACAAWAAPAFVQSAEQQVGGLTTNSVTMLAPSTVGHVLIAYAYSTESNVMIGAGFTQFGPNANVGSYLMTTHWAEVTTPGIKTVTVESVGSAELVLVVGEFSGLQVPVEVDAVDVRNGTADTFSAQVTTTGPALLLEHLGLVNTDAAFDGGTPYSRVAQDWYGYESAPTAGTYTINGSKVVVGGLWLTHVIALKAFGVTDGGVGSRGPTKLNVGCACDQTEGGLLFALLFALKVIRTRRE